MGYVMTPTSHYAVTMLTELTDPLTITRLLLMNKVPLHACGGHVYVHTAQGCMYICPSPSSDLK